MYHKGTCCLSSEGGRRPGALESFAHICMLVLPSAMANSELPPFPVLHFPMAEYKIESKRSIAKGLFLHVPSLFVEENFPKNSQRISPYITLEPDSMSVTGKGE